jgi:fido (protein-threonine AMPylation protein)
MAERLAAAILRIDGFELLDPQLPLGGPDDTKDILCERNHKRYVGAVYFPPTPKTFASIRKKFVADLAGVDRSHAHGIVFVTNQRVTPKDRTKLEKLAHENGALCLVYHVDRLITILDSPAGYGIRLKYLGIEMMKEEQVAFFAEFGAAVVGELQGQASLVREVRHELAYLVNSQGILLNALEVAQPVATVLPTEHLTIAALLMLHRGLSSQAGAAIEVGQFRTVQMAITRPRESKRLPEPALVPQLISDLLSSWNVAFSVLRAASIEERINALAQFHHRFVAIHPFYDLNGAVARELTRQQAADLLGVQEFVVTDRAQYYEALSAADAGDPEPMRKLFQSLLPGARAG